MSRNYSIQNSSQFQSKIPSQCVRESTLFEYRQNLPQFQNSYQNISQPNSDQINAQNSVPESQHDFGIEQNRGINPQQNYFPPQSRLNFVNQNFGNTQPNLQHEQSLNNERVQNFRFEPRQTFLRRLRCIPKFSGNSFNQLKEFIEVVESLYVSCSNEAEENELHEQILLQVRGEARNLIISLNNPNWLTIKNNLLKHFAYLANKEILTSQLENARQYQDEPLNAYAERVRNLLKDKKATYSYMTKDQQLEYDRLARRTFSRGVSNMKLRDSLITRGASSLEDAIAYAIEFENDHFNHITSNELFCTACRNNGHRQKNCPGLNKKNNIMGKLISALRSFSNKNSYNFQNNDNNFEPNICTEFLYSNQSPNNSSHQDCNLNYYDDTFYNDDEENDIDDEMSDSVEVQNVGPNWQTQSLEEKRSNEHLNNNCVSVSENSETEINSSIEDIESEN